MKVVINTDWGGFGLDDSEIKKYSDLAGLSLEHKTDLEGYGEWQYPNGETFYDREIERTDANLIALVESLDPAETILKVVSVPDDVDWYISDHDGIEHVAERHRTWS